MTLDQTGNNFRGVASRVERHLTEQRRTLIGLALLTIAAYFLYGSFFNYAFSLADEGSVALISERLAKGETPYVDVELGYGILWFLPIVSLFKLLGVKLYILKIYFLIIGFASAVFAYGLFLRLTGHHALAFPVALIVLAFPGWGLQPQIPFLVISGLYVLLLYDPSTGRPRIRSSLALLCTGVYLSLAFLIRGDIATVFTLLFLFYQGLLASTTAIDERSSRRLSEFFARVLVVSLVFGLVALPFAWQAKTGGYLEGFLGQYTYFVEGLIGKIQQRFFLPESLSTASAAGSLLPRPGVLTLVFGSDRPGFGRGFTFLVYAPIFALFLILVTLVADFLSDPLDAGRLSRFISERARLLVLTVGAFSTFPQFFVWRPDIPHLYGFLPGFVVLMSYFLFTLRTEPDPLRKFALGRQPVFYLTCALCVIYLVLFEAYSDDGLKLRRDRTTRLTMDRGIDVWLAKWELQEMQQLNSIIREVSRPGEFVLCFPYCPGINFIVDRPTFQRFLYADDSYLVFRPGWLDEMRSEVAARKPKVIVIEDWAINNTEISRFRNWARPLYLDITRNYERRAKVNDFEIFVLR